MTKHCEYSHSEKYEKKDCGYKKPKKCPPNIAGTWSVNEIGVVDGGSISNPQSFSYTATISQNGRLVTFVLDGFTFLGVWQYNPVSGWTLYLVDNNDDNITYILTPIKFKKNNVLKMDAITYKAGTDPFDPAQTAEVFYGTWIRTAY